MADFTVKTVAPVPADSFVKPTIVDISADAIAMELWKQTGAGESGSIVKLRVVIDAPPVALDGDSHTAFWVYYLKDPILGVWQHIISCTDSRYWDFSWNGEAFTMKVVFATSAPMTVGISIKTLYPAT